MYLVSPILTAIIFVFQQAIQRHSITSSSSNVNEMIHCVTLWPLCRLLKNAPCQCDIFGFLFRTVIIVCLPSSLFSESVVKLYRESRRTAARKYARRFMNMHRSRCIRGYATCYAARLSMCPLKTSVKSRCASFQSNDPSVARNMTTRTVVTIVTQKQKQKSTRCLLFQ